MPTHYERLGVRPDDDRETIWRAYLGAVRTALVSNDPAAEIRVLDEAWAVLRAPDTRAAYDRAVGLAGSDTAMPTTGGPGGSEHARPSHPAAEQATGPDREPSLPAQPEEPVHASSRASARVAGRPAEHAEPGDTPAEQPATTPRAHTPADEQPARQPARRRPGPARDRRRAARSSPSVPGRWFRRRVPAVVVWLVACAVVGVALGLGVHLTGERTDAFAEGSCVALGPSEASPVPCGSPQADGRITAIVTEPQACGDVDGGWVERPDGRLACVELLADADS
jgi:curved DNA-binding protein CbpA